MDDETAAPFARVAPMSGVLAPYVAQYCRYLHDRCKRPLKTPQKWAAKIPHFVSPSMR
jgi:hypothetical protein